MPNILTNGSSSAVDIKAITPNDSADLPTPDSRAIYVGTAGNVRVTTRNGTDIVIPNVSAGTLLPIQAKRVWDTNTTASNLQAWY